MDKNWLKTDHAYRALADRAYLICSSIACRKRQIDHLKKITILLLIYLFEAGNLTLVICLY